MYEVFVEVTESDVLCNQLVVLAYYGSTNTLIKYFLVLLFL